jgi:hypothetical protein
MNRGWRVLPQPSDRFILCGRPRRSRLLLRFVLDALLVGVMLAAGAAPVGASDLPPGTVTLEGELTGGALVQEWQDYVSDFEVLWNRFDIRIYPLSDGTGQVSGSGVVRRQMTYTYVLEDRTDVFRYRDEIQISIDGTWDATGRVTATVVETTPAHLVAVQVIQGRQPSPTTEDRVSYGAFEGTWSGEMGILGGEIQMPDLVASTLEAYAVATEPEVPESTTTTSQPTLEEEFSQISYQNPAVSCSDPEETAYVVMSQTPTRDRAWFENPLNVSAPERIVTLVAPGTQIDVPEGFEVEIRSEHGGPEAVLRGPAQGSVPCDSLLGQVDASIVEWLAGQVTIHVTGPEPAAVRTPHLTAEVTGTTFLVDVTDSATTVVVLEGTVEVTGATAGHQTVAAGQETISSGVNVPEPQRTDPADLAARYPWLDGALQALTQPFDLPGATGETTPATEETSAGSAFPIWPVVIAAALLALLAAGGLLWASRRRQRGTASRALPPPPAPEDAPPPPPPPPQ